MEACIHNPKVFDYQKPFDETDLVDIQETVKHMNIGKSLFDNLSHNRKSRTYHNL